MTGANLMRSRSLWFGAGALVLLGAWAQLVLNAAAYVRSGDLRDFVHGYSAAHQVLAQGWQGLYDIATQEHFQHEYIAQSGAAPGSLLILPFVNLPPTVLLFFPLAGLPASLALGLWVALNVILLCVALWLAVGISSARPRAWLTVALVPLLMPFAWGVLVGQPVGVFVLLYTLTLRALLRGSDWTAGVWLSLIFVIKPQLVIGALVFLVVQRFWRPLAAFVVCAGALGAVGLVLIGASGVTDYATLLTRLDSFRGDPLLGLRTSLMVNWRSWLAFVPGLDDTTGFAASLLVGGLTLLVVGYVWRRRASSDAELIRVFLCCTAAGLLASYHSHYQDVSILAPPAVAAIGLWLGSVPDVSGFLVQLRHNRVVLASALLLLLVPGVTWVLFGGHALVRTGVWSLLAAPGLMLLLTGTLAARSRETVGLRHALDASAGVRA